MAPINSAIELQAKAKRSRGDHEMARILIVEDEPNMVAGLRDNFEFEGYQVITAPDGVAGLERALNEAPDLVILDVMMPRMSGLDVCKQLFFFSSRRRHTRLTCDWSSDVCSSDLILVEQHI